MTITAIAITAQPGQAFRSLSWPNGRHWFFDTNRVLHEFAMDTKRCWLVDDIKSYDLALTDFEFIP